MNAFETSKVGGNMFDWVIKNAAIVDGSGKPAYQADIAISNDRIEAIGIIPSEAALNVIDAGELIVAPGFIDIHCHYDTGLWADAALEGPLSQGVTTVICGQCGDSRAPIEPQMADGFRQWCEAGAAGAFVPYNWDSFSSFLDIVDDMKLGVNLGSFVGHSTLRLCAVGFENKRPTREEIEKMKRLAAESIEQGALGISTGLVYMPGMYADTEELIEVTKAIKPYGVPYMSHIRSESNEIISAVEEELAIARACEVPCQVAHHKALGKSNWWKIDKTLALLDEARSQGIDVTCDLYPYVLSTSAMRNLLPPWALTNGMDTVCARLADPIERQKIIDDILDFSNTNNIWRDSGGGEGIYAMDTPLTPQYEGLNMEEASVLSGKSPLETALDIIMINRGKDAACYATGCEENILKVASKEYSMFGSDAVPCTPGSKCNPRNNGTFPRVLGKYCREEHLFDLPEAVYKMTGAPAKRLNLKHKGHIAVGKDADLVVFNPATVIDRATTKDPMARPVGIEWVFVRGKLAIAEGKPTHLRNGKTVRYGD